jgi:phosphoserine phosphatase
MAEPIIVSYARGLLREFPGVPEGVTDVIPVDLVVAAIIAVAGDVLLAPPADIPTPDVYHVASGVRNPFRYGRLVELVQTWFTEHPLYDTDGQPIVVPAWSFPGRGRVQRQLSRASRAMELAERVVGSLPIRGRQATWLAALEERHLLADRALGYVELYGAYTETEARYRVDRLMELWDRMDEDDRRAFCLDPATVDWAVYVRDIHLPSVIEHARVRTSPTRSTQPNRADRARKAILSPDRHLAAFDLENTLIASNVVDSYAWLASRHLSDADRVAFVADLVSEAPGLLALDRRDRGDFLRSFYRRYEGAPVARLQDDGWELFHQLLLAKSFPAGFARVRRHRALGHRTLLITGALDLVVEPLRPLFDDIICARLGQADGRFTGRLEELPPIGEARALVLADYAEAEGLRLDESMAVNPEAKLAAIARRRGWHVEHWHKADGGSPPLLPLGPRQRPGSPPRTKTSQAALTGALRRAVSLTADGGTRRDPGR